MTGSWLRSGTRQLAVGPHAAPESSACLIALLAITLGAGGCATSPQRAPVETIAAAHSEGGPAAGYAPREIPRESLNRLASSVEALGAEPQGPQHAGVIDALRQLANAIELLPEPWRYPIEAIRESARRLEASDGDTLSGADRLKEGLEAALQSLVTRSGFPGHELDFQRAIGSFSDSVEAIRKQRPLLKQSKSITVAFRAAADAVFLAVGGESHFGEAEAGGSDVAQVSLEGSVDAARAEVLKLGQTNWTQARQASSLALASLADVVAAADRRNALGRKVSAIRFQAERVRYSDSLAFGRAAWIKAGLLAALDVLDTLRLNDEKRLSGWTRAARSAVGSIEDRQSLAFQRAAVQDAFRATVDAFVAATQLSSTCR